MTVIKERLSIFLKMGIFLFLLTAIISCGTTQGLSTKQNLISPGQSREEVTNALGNPGNKQFQGKDEAWQYCQTGLSADLYVVVWFYDGKVTGMNSYNGYGIGNCTQFFRTINWQEAPDRTIEFRDR